MLRTVGRLLLHYGPLAFLAGALLFTVLHPTLFGDRPRPEIPPDGFVTHDLSVPLSWRRGDAEGPLKLQLARGKPDFRNPVFEREGRTTSAVTPALERGSTYFWRLEQDDGAIVGWFRTSPHGVDY